MDKNNKAKIDVEHSIGILPLKNGISKRVIRKKYKINTIDNKIHEIIENSIVDDVDYIMKWRSRWYIIKNISAVISKISILLSSFLAFASNHFGRTDMSFMAGSLSLASVALSQFSEFAKSKHAKKTQEINKIVNSLGIDIHVPNIGSSNDEKLTLGDIVPDNPESNDVLLDSPVSNDQVPDDQVFNDNNDNIV